MRNALSLWWSLLWRITLAVVLFSYPVEWLARLTSLLDDPTWIQLRPTFYWAVLSALFWIAGAGSPRFLKAILWGERLALPTSDWVAIARSLSVFFVVLAVLNVVIARSGSIETWITFKALLAYPLLAGFLRVVAFGLRRSANAA